MSDAFKPGIKIQIMYDTRKKECSNCESIPLRCKRSRAEGTDDAARKEKKVESSLKELLELASELGAGDAAVISTTDIAVEADLAKLCREPRCTNFGLSARCPPHISGPSGFQKQLHHYKHAIVIKIDIPSEILLSNQRNEIFQMLHEIVAAIEQAAIGKGFFKSKAYAGGSCKELFCTDHADCRVLAKQGECRNHQKARPSMSGFGINVAKLMKASGMPYCKVQHESEKAEIPMGTVCGLILIG